MKTNNNPTLSIIIPLYNEERRLPKTFAAIERFVLSPSAPSFEIVFVDDGSVDGTAQDVRNFMERVSAARLVLHARNCGKGAAVRTGMLAARGMWRVFLDADMATDLSEFQKCAPLLASGAAVVIGSRRMSGADVQVHQSLIREVMGSVYTVLARFFTGADVSDFTCGFKCFSARAAEAIFLRARIARWSYDAEILFLAHRLGFSIQEVPVVWRNDGATRVRLWKDAPRAFFDLWVMRLFALLGYYQL